MSYGYWKPYVSVAERRRKAKKKMAQLQKKGTNIQPVEIEGRKIAKSFWGIAWNDHLESFADYANRIPRGRTYVRNGSVCHLDIKKGQVIAMVSGSEIYKIRIDIDALPEKSWRSLKKKCVGQVGSLLDLLQGKLSDNVMAVVTDRKTGMFPGSKQIHLDCNCPDGAYMCKHLAAVLYGVGARLDQQPELLFALRGVDHQELISVDVELSVATGKKQGKGRRIAADSLADVFGIEMADQTVAVKKKVKKQVAAKKAVKGSVKKGPASKKITKRVAKKKVSTAKKRVARIARKKPPRQRNEKNELIYSGSIIVSMRKKFNMTPIEFALLVGVSTLTVHNWENSAGELKLRRNSREALEQVEKFSKRKAWQEMEEL
ncbi:MAG: SWIM zinc finger family protein [Verrucomicrobiales bacterium]|nr:SWIM zinc finger family protein [Verrucomicrobiales bacterium]